jgi:hypothetical protein
VVLAIVSASSLVLDVCFSLLDLFGELFHLLYVFMCDHRRHVVRGRASAEV